jgi:hypothetical protein
MTIRKARAKTTAKAAATADPLRDDNKKGKGKDNGKAAATADPLRG